MKIRKVEWAKSVLKSPKLYFLWTIKDRNFKFDMVLFLWYKYKEHLKNIYLNFKGGRRKNIFNKIFCNTERTGNWHDSLLIIQMPAKKNFWKIRNLKKWNEQKTF